MAANNGPYSLQVSRSTGQDLWDIIKSRKNVFIGKLCSNIS